LPTLRTILVLQISSLAAQENEDLAIFAKRR